MFYSESYILPPLQISTVTYRTLRILFIFVFPFVNCNALMSFLQLFITAPAVATIITSICLSIMYTSTKWLLTNFPGSFTLGEGALLGQAAALSVTCSIYSLIQTALSQQQLSETQETSVFIQVSWLFPILCD